MACEDLRHVCGGCGFKWPERSAYDALILANAKAREERDAVVRILRDLIMWLRASGGTPAGALIEAETRLAELLNETRDA